MNYLVSICIPTYHRPQLLQKALESCFAQQYEPIEILIGDDSRDNVTEKLVEDIQLTCTYKLQYVHNSPSLGQAGNINRLFEMADGDRLVLLHDDDLLLPNALVDLDRCWQVFPDLIAACGKQYIISMSGEVLEHSSEKLNKYYYRTADKEGLQASALEAALVQQFPNDGYMLLSSAAKSIKWRSKEEVGNGCEFDFGLRLASTFHKFYFLNQYTAKYRLTDNSMSQNADDWFLHAYQLTGACDVPKTLVSIRKQLPQKKAPMVVSYYVQTGQKRKALNVYLSEYYSMGRRFTFKGFFHLLLIVMPNFFAQELLRTLKKSKLLASHS